MQCFLYFTKLILGDIAGRVVPIHAYNITLLMRWLYSEQLGEDYGGYAWVCTTCTCVSRRERCSHTRTIYVRSQLCEWGYSLLTIL